MSLTRDETLVRSTLAGDHDAFGELVEEYAGLVRGVLLDIVRDAEDLEDLSQDVT